VRLLYHLTPREGIRPNSVDTQTRHAIKHDALIDHANSALAWLEEHKSQALLVSGLVVAVLVIGISSILFYQHRQEEASVAFGAAMDIYSAPVDQPGTPSEPGVRTYPSATARAKAANAEFLKVADSFGSTDGGKNALYFAGLTAMEMGNTAAAETTLKKVSDHGDANLSSLADIALVSLYRQSGKTSDAIDLLKHLASHPTTAVPAGQANLELASIYEETNPGQAKQIYAQLKDKDSKTTAGQIAAQKLQQMH
jgi:predicted negative regulator of RcsB-dependent stress response